jgi:hypothetical protein
MDEEKKEEIKGYTFTDKRGLDKEETQEGKETKEFNPGVPEENDQPGPARPIDFTTLIMSLASSALVSMGRVPDPETGTVRKNFVFAQQNIDIIHLLQEKTRGNLSSDEEHLTEQILYELRMTYISALKDEK